MPFTLSHAAAALPFRRAPLVPSALLIGTFAPDLEYFIRLQAGGGWGHTLPGSVAMDLPLGLAALWLFHRLVKVPLVYLLSDRVRARLTNQLVPFRFSPPRRFLLIVVSMLIGIATHLVWDGFTHTNYWIARRVPFLSRSLHLPVVGWGTIAGLLQLLSSLAGLLILAAWCGYWYKRTRPDAQIPPSPVTHGHRLVIVSAGLLAAALGAVLRAWLSIGFPSNILENDAFVDQVIVTFGALVWWQLAMWGLLGPFRHTHRATSEEETYMRSRASLRQ